MQKQLILLDQSAAKRSHCARLLYWTLLKSYRSALNDHSAEWGQGFHLFAKVLEESGGNCGLATRSAAKYFREAKYIPDPKRKHLTDLTLAYACQAYYDEPYHNDPFDTLKDHNDCGVIGVDGKFEFPQGRPLVEKRFAIDLYESDVVKILLCGTIDKIVVHRTSKLLCIGDYKSSSSWNANEYLDSYQLNNQLPTYIYALKRLIADATPDSCLAPFKDREIRGFIDGVFPSMANGTFKVEFKRSKVFEFKESDLEEYKHLLMQLCLDIERMVKDTTGVFSFIPLRQGIMNNTCGMFGGCDFSDACKNEWDKQRQQFVLDKNFIVKSYNPMSHGE